MGTAIMRAMVEAAPRVGVRCIVNEHYRGAAPLLMSYGLGHPIRMHQTQAHVARGGRLIGWDLGYWRRNEFMRVTVDNGHPQRFMRDMPRTRWRESGIQLRNDYNPGGHIVLVGIGEKSRAQFRFSGQEWEARKLEDIRRAYPGWEVIYRPKRPESLEGCRSAGGMIEDVLRGASLVVCRHSNVAVDACIAGVPVVCEDGASAALYGSDLSSPVNPGKDERRRFLQNLAWWQWKTAEAEQAWRFLRTVLG